jgi:hypothetical protein
MLLPDWIYRMLPAVYLVIGLIVMSKMDSPVGTASGVLLALAGVIIWQMRVDYRREIHRETFETIDTLDRHNGAAAGTSGKAESVGKRATRA